MTDPISEPFGAYAPDLEHCVRWASGDELVTTPAQAALRWAITTDDVIAGLTFLAAEGRQVTPSPSDLRAESEFSLRFRAARTRRGGQG